MNCAKSKSNFESYSIKRLIQPIFILTEPVPFYLPVKRKMVLRIGCVLNIGRTLNSRAIKNGYPLQRIDWILDWLQGAENFLKLIFDQALTRSRSMRRILGYTKIWYGLSELTVPYFGVCDAPWLKTDMINSWMTWS